MVKTGSGGAGSRAATVFIACEQAPTKNGDRNRAGRHEAWRSLQIYSETAGPVLAHYRARGLLREIDASGSPDTVFNHTRAVLRALPPVKSPAR